MCFESVEVEGFDKFPPLIQKKKHLVELTSIQNSEEDKNKHKYAFYFSFQNKKDFQQILPLAYKVHGSYLDSLVIYFSTFHSANFLKSYRHQSYFLFSEKKGQTRGYRASSFEIAIKGAWSGNLVKIQYFTLDAKLK